MEVQNNKCLVFGFKLIKCLCTPVSRLRKLSRKTNMRQFKIGVGVLAIISCFITFLLYYWHHFSTTERHLRSRVMEQSTILTTVEKELLIMGTPMRHMPLNEIYKDNSKHDSDYSFELEDRKMVTMINTPGCTIPVAMVDYEKYMKKLNNVRTCGRRAVFLKKTDGDKVYAMIRANNMKKYLRKSAHFDCCYRFIQRSARAGHGNTNIHFTSCKKLQHGSTITLLTDFINIKCSEYDKRNVSRGIYDDVYAFTKKISVPKADNKTCSDRYNVLILGMDSMSLPRFAKTMKRTVAFFQDNFWLAFRGYHKVGDNTFPNLMAAFTGHNLSTLTEKCSGKMDECNNLLMWSRFQREGYVTAYGEDYLRLPDTFNTKYAFRKPPTHHYMRPLYVKGETELNNKSLVCAGKVPSGQQLLDYALDFAFTYRKDNFFGVFWMNSFSHNINSRPQDSDKMFENLFNRLTYTGVLDNTFIIFFSDHGIRFGDHRLKVESYYDERMPFMFVWSPTIFKGKHSLLYDAAAFNQFKLITPYDIFNTLVEINSISECRNFSGSVSEACPKCQSLFKDIENNRTCQDVAIHEKWCSCHKLYPLDILDVDGVKSVLAVVSYIKSMVNSVKTKRCWSCMSLSLKNVIRIHFYYDKSKTNLYHVVAFAMNPGNVSYEATVLRKGENIELIGSVSIISPYRGLGKCTNQSRDRLFCVCQRVHGCH